MKTLVQTVTALGGIVSALDESLNLKDLLPPDEFVKVRKKVEPYYKTLESLGLLDRPTK